MTDAVRRLPDTGEVGESLETIPHKRLPARGEERSEAACSTIAAIDQMHTPLRRLETKFLRLPLAIPGASARWWCVNRRLYEDVPASHWPSIVTRKAH